MQCFASNSLVRISVEMRITAAAPAN